MRRDLLLAACVLVVLTATAPFLGQMFVRQSLYPAPPVPVPAEAPDTLETLRLETANGDTIVGWLRALDDGPVVLFLHGNGENLATLHRADVFGDFARRGASVLAIDYPGYGRSTGTPSQRSLVASGQAGLAAIRSRFPDRRCFVVGWSLGAAVAVQTALPVEDELDGLALLSPWHDLPDLASRYFPRLLVRLLLRDRYDSGSAADRITLETLVVHGSEDPIIPIDHARRLAARLPENHRYLALPGAGHNDLLARGETWLALETLLDAGRGSETPGHGRDTTRPAG